MKLTALLALGATGCSLMAQNGPAYLPERGQPAPSCSTSRGAPFADSLLAFVTAIPTAAAVAIAWDDPRWEYVEDGEVWYGGAKVGAYLGIPFGALLALAVVSAVHGYRAATRCETALARAAAPPDQDPHTLACRATIQAIADGGLASAPPLPRLCDRAVAEDALLIDADGVARDTLAGASLRVHARADRITAIEIERPRVTTASLGEPDARLDDGTWLYAARGLALVVEGETVTRAEVFPPTTVEGYRRSHAEGE